MNMKLEKGERRILQAKLSNVHSSFWGKLILLTDKRIVVLSRSFFKKEYKPELEIPIDRIAEAYPSVSAFIGNAQLKLKLKNGDEETFNLAVSNTSFLVGTDDTIGRNQKAITDRWVNAINNLL